MWLKSIIAIIILFALMFSMIGFLRIVRNFSFQGEVADKKIVGWIPYWDQESAKNTFYSNSSLFDYISLFWYRVGPDGNLTTYQSAKEDLSIVDFAHSRNVKAFALIANMADYHENDGWDFRRIDKVIYTSEARAKHISDIVQLVEDKNFDGVDIDYEMLKEYQKENFSLFIEELSKEMHRRGKMVGVAIHPATADSIEDNGPLAQDLPRLAKAADQLYFMTYLEHGTFSAPGPVGSIKWIEKVLSHAIDAKNIPKKKIFLGVGLMGVAWRIDPGGPKGDREEITFQEILLIAQNNNTEPIWDSASLTPRLEYNDNNGKHIIWFENNESIKARIELAKKLGVGGLGLWRLGGEDQKIWKTIRMLKV